MEMADDMGISIDDILSSIAEDSVIDLKRFHQDLEMIFIPDKCTFFKTHWSHCII